jgi:hypothetical protein
MGGGGDGGGDGGGGLRTAAGVVGSVEEDGVVPLALVLVLKVREPSNAYSVVVFTLLMGVLLVNLCTTVL